MLKHLSKKPIYWRSTPGARYQLLSHKPAESRSRSGPSET